VFQSTFRSNILNDFNGVVCQINDVLAFGTGKTEHDKRLANVLKQSSTAGIIFD